MPRFFAAVLVVFLLFLALFVVRCQATPREDLLMAATFGEQERGSYSRYHDSDVLEWRSRGHYRLIDGREVVVDGYGDCRVGNTATLYGLDNVYLFDAESRRPLLVIDDDTVVRLPRPSQRDVDAIEVSGDTADEISRDDGGSVPEPDAASSVGPDQFLRLDRSGYSAGFVEVRPGEELPGVDQPEEDPIGGSNEIRELDPAVIDFPNGVSNEVVEQIQAQFGVRSLIPNPVGAGADRALFEERVTHLVNVVRAAGLTPLIGLDVALMPSQWHGKGGDDPTAAPAGAVSRNLEAAARSTSAVDSTATTDRVLWVADFGLPEGSDESDWPDNIDPGADPRQQRPASDATVTPEFGHGLMVASVAAQAAPDATVKVLNVSEVNPVGDEWITVSTIDAALTRHPDLRTTDGVLNLSIGAYDCAYAELPNYRGPVMEGLWAVLEPYVGDPDLLVVAAAGNDGATAPMYPAAFNGVVGVGATDATVLNRSDCLVGGVEAWDLAVDSSDPSCQPFPDSLAPFSNVGINANAAEPGVDVIVHYPLFPSDPIEYRYHRYIGASAQLDTGKVRISGTSMAAPLFAACHLPDLTSIC